MKGAKNENRQNSFETLESSFSFGFLMQTSLRSKTYDLRSVFKTRKFTPLST
jgi:hypothetical protein